MTSRELYYGHKARLVRRAVICLAAALVLAACGVVESEQNYPKSEGRGHNPDPSGPRDSIFGPGGISLFGGDKSDQKGGSVGGSGIGINSFLWRASLDTLSFMPLNSADPFGGVIITDWYSTVENPKERFKMTVYILDRRLRADGIKVAVFKQTLGNATQWLNADVAGDTAIQLENAILVRARQLRLDTLEQ